MAKVVKIFKTVKDNWKKSIFAVVVTAYGVRFIDRKYEYVFISIFNLQLTFHDDDVNCRHVESTYDNCGKSIKS